MTISRLEPSVLLINKPWPEADVDKMLVMKIKRFDSDQAGNVMLDVSWGIIDQKKRVMTVINESRVNRSGDSAAFASVTKTMSEALLELSREIAKELK